MRGEAVLLLFALGAFGLLFSALAALADWMDRRSWRRQIAAAHRPRPMVRGVYDRERA